MKINLNFKTCKDVKLPFCFPIFFMAQAYHVILYSAQVHLSTPGSVLFCIIVSLPSLPFS